MRRRFGSGDDAVSDVVGTVLLLGITVAAFSVLSVAVLDQFDRNPPPARVEFRVDTVGSRTSITAVWGESIDIEDTKLIYEINYARTIREVHLSPLAGNLIHRIPDSLTSWDVGETIRLSCPVGETCAHPGDRITNVSVVQTLSNTVLFSSEPGVSRGSILNPVADLLLTVESITDPLRAPTEPLYSGGTIQSVVKIRNDGVLSIPADRQLNIRFYVDGSTTPFHTSTQTGGLAPGAFFFVTTTPAFTATTGTHSLRAVVEATPAVIEAAYGNNEVIRAFTVVAGVFDPGAPYEDGNGDILYNPYVASDNLLAAATVLDGVHTAPAGKSLIIPASVGPIVTTNSITFSAPSGRLYIRVGLETTNPPSSITLNGATTVNVTGTFDVKSRDDLLITSAGQIDVSGVRLDTDADPIMVRSTGGPVFAVNTAFAIPLIGTLPSLVDIDAVGGAFLSDARFETTSSVNVQGNGRIYVNRAVFTVGTDIIFDLGSGDRAYVSQARFDDLNDQAEITPGNWPGSGRCAIGVPAFGSVDDVC